MSHDNHLQEAVLEELNWEPSVTAAHLGVAANAGVITLTGHVESFAQKHAAETAVRRVKGVKAVAEEIEVRLPYATKTQRRGNRGSSDRAIRMGRLDTARHH
jgi:osmotically-inducible protein OsmY